MYRFSRAIYRELAADVIAPAPLTRAESHHAVIRACEAAVERLALDPHSCARPSRSLFRDVRPYFPIHVQRRVQLVIERYLAFAERFLTAQRETGHDGLGRPLECRATTRRGAPCRRQPLPRNGYCPSHQHLAESEDGRVGVGAAA